MPGGAAEQAARRARSVRTGNAVKLSVIIPTLDEADGVAAALRSLAPLRGRGHELILVDGGSTDGTPDLARDLCDRIVAAPASRSGQMNAGARLAQGDVLLFLHADSRLPENADRLVLDAVAGGGRDWGRFDVRIDSRNALLRLVETTMNWRSRVTHVCTGDQGLFVRRKTFDAIGGFPAQELMEDIAISKRLRRLSAPVCLRDRILTSARRWENRGVLRTIVLMGWLRLQYFLGVSPARLARSYGVRSH